MKRYEKQILFEGIGIDGQKQLQSSKVIVIGCGALGTVICNNLVRAGVGHIKIVDRDYIELSNLQRQTLFDEIDIENNLPKAEAAKRKLSKINSEIVIEAKVTDVNSNNIEGLCKGMDLILDATDNFNIRYLINDISIKLNIPWIYGGVIGSTGVLSPIIPEKTPCFRCFMPETPSAGAVETCDTVGVLNGITSIVASYQSNEALKILTSKYDNLINGLLYIDIWENSFETVNPSKKKNCKACGTKEYEFLQRKDEEAVILCGKNSIQINPYNKTISVDNIIKRLNSIGIFPKKNNFFIRFEIEDFIFTLFYDGRAIIKNATNINQGKTLYSKYIGY